MNLVEHLEHYLGEIEVGWQHDADGNLVPFQIVRFGHGPSPNTVTFATLGLWKHPLHSKVPDKHIRHELLLLVPAALRDATIPSLLHQVGTEAIAADRALLRGDVIGPRGPLLPDSQMEALYVTAPVYWPDEFAVCREGEHDIVLVWLVPITHAEAHYVFTRGWEAFEERLVELDPDLTDVYRASLDLTQPPTGTESVDSAS